jgi:hypothetical protein
VVLFLAVVGLYGVTAYVAGRRARECAIRRVVGASRLSILHLLVGSSMRTVLLGLGAGVGMSLAIGWLLKDALLGASFDPRALVLAPLALAATALLRRGASGLPGRFRGPDDGAPRRVVVKNPQLDTPPRSTSWYGRVAQYLLEAPAGGTAVPRGAGAGGVIFTAVTQPNG